MIDIKLIRTNPQLVKNNIKKKFQDEKLVLVDEVEALDKEFREAKTRGDYLRDRIAMRRPGNPEEILGVVVLLASDASSYISGSNYVVDGGCLCGGAPWDFDSAYRYKGEDQ